MPNQPRGFSRLRPAAAPRTAPCRGFPAQAQGTTGSPPPGLTSPEGSIPSSKQGQRPHGNERTLHRPVVDVHTHYIPEELIELIGSGKGPTGLTVEQREGKDPLIVHDNGLRYPAFEVFRDQRARLAYMDESGVDVSIISISPSLYLYWLDPGETAESAASSTTPPPGWRAKGRTACTRWRRCR